MSAFQPPSVTSPQSIIFSAKPLKKHLQIDTFIGSETAEINEKTEEIEGKLREKRRNGNEFLDVLDAAIENFREKPGKEVTLSPKSSLFTRISQLKSHLNLLKSEQISLLEANSTLESQQNKYSSHISALTLTLQSLELEYDAVTSPQRPEPRRTIDTPQGYSESPYIPNAVFAQPTSSRLPPIQVSNVLSFT